MTLVVILYGKQKPEKSAGLKVVIGFWMTFVLPRSSLKTKPCTYALNNNHMAHASGLLCFAAYKKGNAGLKTSCSQEPMDLVR